MKYAIYRINTDELFKGYGDQGKPLWGAASQRDDPEVWKTDDRFKANAECETLEDTHRFMVIVINLNSPSF